MSVFLVLDIETAPRGDEWVKDALTRKVAPPANYKSAEAIEKWNKEKRPEAESKAMAAGALSGTYGQVTAIGWKIGGDPVQVLARAKGAGRDEKQILELFFDDVRKSIVNNRNIRPVWTGFNIGGFDLRFLYQRALVNGVRMDVGMPWDATPWSGKYLDLMQWWCGTKGCVRKEDVCQAFGIAIPDDAVSGSEMPKLFAEGKADAIAKHCRQDVELTAALLDKYMEGRA